MLLPMSRNRDFMILWSAQAVSEFGSAMSVLVFPLIGYAVSGSAREAGLATTAVLLGELLALLPAGVIVDRTSRRTVLVAANLVGAAAYAALAATALTHTLTISLLVALGLLSGAAQSFVGPANAAAIRLVVPREQLPDALAQSYARSHAANIAGPPAGGALFSLARGLPFVVDALSYVGAAALITRVRHRLPSPVATVPGTAERPGADPAGQATGGRAAVRSLGDGMRLLIGTAVLRTMMTWAALVNFSGAYLGVLITLRLVRAGVAPAAIGSVDTVAAVAGLIGAVLAPAIVRRTATGVLTIATGVVVSCAMFLTAFTTDVVVIGVLWGAATLLSPASSAGISAYVTSIVPDTVQGRLFSAMGLTANGVAALAPLLAGVLLTALGGVAATVVGALVGVAAAVPILLNRATRTLGRPSTWASSRPVGQPG